MLKLFFGTYENVEDYLQVIKKFDVDRFRPLDNFLKERVTDTDNKNIELLAWLIDFEPRPYKFELSAIAKKIVAEPAIMVEGNGVTQEAAEVIFGGSLDKMIEPRPGELKEKAGDDKKTENILANLSEECCTPPEKVIRFWKTRNAVVVIFVLAIAGLVTYLAAMRTNRCMCWLGNHYVVVPCDKKSSSTPLLAFDTLKLQTFKRIATPDTITLKALGKVWYLKINGDIEYYTAGGYHPIYAERRLKPITKYIIDKYILHSKQRSN